MGRESMMALQRLITGSLLVLAIGCGGDGGSQCFDSNFGDAKVDGLLKATGNFSTTATELEKSVRDACNAISSDLGGASSDDTKTACENAVAQINQTLENTDVTLVVDFVAPICSVDLDAVVDCTAACDVNFDATATPPTCTGGELSGSCSGSCEGECTVSGDVACSASCSGSCSGICDATVSATCSGTCTGQCDGVCTVINNATGNCEGSCEGTCHGTCEGTIEGSCSGKCTGTCSGSCRVDSEASCSGTCSGSCDVAFTEPKCEGGKLEVQADADCKAACETDASLDVSCNEPSIVFSFTGDASDDVFKLVTTLEANYGAILAAAAQLEGIVTATVDLGGRLGGAVTAAASLGVKASDCVAQAIEAQIAAASSVSISVEASVSVSGSVSGSTN